MHLSLPSIIKLSLKSKYDGRCGLDVAVCALADWICVRFPVLFSLSVWITSSKREKCLQIKKSKFGQIADPPLCFLQTYVDYMTRLYEREIKDFFEVAKIKMAGTSKDGKGKFGKTSIKLSFLNVFIRKLTLGKGFLSMLFLQSLYVLCMLC